MKIGSLPPVLTPVALLFVLAIGALAADPVHKDPAPVSPDTGLARLTEGNKRFVAGTPARNTPTAQQWAELAKGQHPFAIVLTCADSRLSPELIFDQGLGDLFVLRNAGNLADPHVLGSMEYAVEHLGCRLIIVLGHTKCGAVTAAVSGGEAPGHIKDIVDDIIPAASMAKKKPGDPVENAVRINTKFTANAISQAEPILGHAVKAGQLKVVSARYDISTGAVEFLQ
ncbi:MAG: carbonic anhydrase [Nibricoccus sp.]